MSPSHRATLLTWNHPFGAIEGPARLIAAGLAARGWVVSMVNVNQTDQTALAADIRTLVHEPPDLVLSMTPLPLSLRIGDKVLAEYLRSRLVVLCVDSPIYLPKAEWQLLGRLPEGSTLLFVDARHVTHARKALAASLDYRQIDVAFLPFGGPHPVNLDDADSAESDHRARPYDLTLFATLDVQIHTAFAVGDRFTGAFPALQAERFAQRHAEIENLAQSMVDGQYGVDLVDRMTQAFNLGPLHGDEDELELLKTFDSYLKRYRRHRLTQALMDGTRGTDVKVAVYGTGWQHMKDMPSTWTVHGPVPYLEQFAVFRRSRLVLNLDPNWSHGVHDRVFNAMSVGTPALTNDNAWASSCLDDGHDGLLFSTAQGAVAQLLSNRGRSEAIANAAVRTLGWGLHRWQDRCALFDRLIEDRRH